MPQTPEVRELANTARDALLDKLSSEIYDGQRVATKSRRYHQALDALAAALDADRAAAERYLLGGTQ